MTHSLIIASVKFDLDAALELEKLHRCVEHFSTTFAGIALDLFKNLVDPDESSVKSGFLQSSTESKLIRFRCSFWRFELYCNIFRRRIDDGASEEDYFTTNEQEDVFLYRFALFENEQLVCVYQYLRNVVSRSHDDVAGQNISWAEECSFPWLNYYPDFEPSFTESLLARGLASIFQMDEADRYEERCDLFQIEHDDLALQKHFLLWHLRRAGSMLSTGESELDDVTLEEARLAARQPASAETDDGPLIAWKWAYGKGFSIHFFRPENRFHRERAYVMWDRNRLLL